MKIITSILKTIEAFIWVVSVIITIYLCLHLNAECLKGFVTKDFLSLVGNIMAILLGFVATTVSVFFSITNRPVFLRLRQRNLTKKFVWSYSMFFFLGIFVLVYSLILITGYSFFQWVYIFYFVCVESFLCYFIRLQRMTLWFLEVLINED